MDDVTQLIANPTASASRSDNNKSKNAKDSAIFYTVPLKGVAEIVVFFVVKLLFVYYLLALSDEKF